MPLLARVKGVRDSLLRASRLERELDAELRAFVDEMTDRFVAQGLTPDAARRAAVLELGGVEQVKERVREVWLGHAIEATLADVRQAWRGLWRAPAFAAVTILTLGLGIGATAAIFGVVRALLLEDLPYRDARQLVFVWSDLRAGGYPRGPLAGPELQALRDRGTRFSGFGGIWSNSTVLTERDPEQLRIGLVTPDFFSVLGAAPALGRTFRAEDDGPGAPRTILLSAALWRRRFDADASLVGRTIDVAGRPTIVIGVLPDAFRLLLPPDASVPDDLEAWLPFDRDMVTGARGAQFLRVVGRMKPGVALRDAQAEIEAIAAQVGREEPYYGGLGLTLYGVSLHADAVREVRPALLALFAGVALLLTVACVNVAGLLIARASARGHETAMRVALGAGVGRLFRQYAIEGIVLGALGGAAGLAIGGAGLAALLALRPAALSRIDAATIDPTVIAFTAGVALTWGFLLSLAPLAELRRADVAHRLQGGGGRRRVVSALPYRRRALLVVCQVALSVVLLVGAGLLVRAFLQLSRIDPGFSSEGVVTFRLSIAGDRYESSWEATTDAALALRRRLEALPGVIAAGAISHLPYDELPNWSTPYLREGDTQFEHSGTADTRSITPGFFEAVGAQLIDGRFFTDADTADAAPVAIVDERFARRTWPGQRAVGQRIQGTPIVRDRPTVTLTVVGVVRHLRHRRPTEEVREQLYFTLPQAPRNPMAYVVRLAAPSDPRQTGVVYAAARDATDATDTAAAAVHPANAGVVNAGVVNVAAANGGATHARKADIGAAHLDTVRSDAAPLDASRLDETAARIRREVAALDPRLPVFDVRPLSDYGAEARAPRRFTMLLAAAFAAAALALAGIGVYGVTAYAVAQRRHELGVRLALGASRAQIAGLVMRESTRLAAAGLILGLIGAAIAAWLLRGQLAGVSPTDPIAYAAAVPALAAAVALAAWLPARRLTRLEPADSLRTD